MAANNDYADILHDSLATILKQKIRKFTCKITCFTKNLMVLLPGLSYDI